MVALGEDEEEKDRMNIDQLKGQFRHVLTSGGWLVFLLVFLPREWWERAVENVKHIGTIAGALGGVVAVASHWWSASEKKEPQQ